MKIIKGEQGTDEWFTDRLGSVGGSSISPILADGKGKEKLLNQFFNERISGKKTKTYKSADMDMGNEYEPTARGYYEITRGVDVETVSLILSDTPGVHVSPDGLVNPNGGIEIKCRIPSVYREKVQSDSIEIGHVRQCQHFLWIAEREWCDYINFCPDIYNMEPDDRPKDLKDPMKVVRLFRDEKMIREIRVAVTLFLEKLNGRLKR